MKRSAGPHRIVLILAGLAAVATGLALLVATTRGPPPVSQNQPGTFAFAALGDAPYYKLEDMQYRIVLQDLAAHDLTHVLHVGDLFWTACTDQRYQRTLREFNALPHPVIYTPGDNEWTDCWEHRKHFAPLERLARIRALFFADPRRSLGQRRIALVHQEGTEFVENARWVVQGVVFATAHIVGSGNATDTFPGRTHLDDEERRRRTAAGAAWLRQTFAEARRLNAPAVVIAFHASAEIEEPASTFRQNYEPFLSTLEEEVARFGRPVLLIHGDGHDYTLDRPLTRRSTGQRLTHAIRLQVPGSPAVGWVRITVAPGRPQPFTFERRVLPWWKYW